MIVDDMSVTHLGERWQVLSNVWLVTCIVSSFWSAEEGE